MPDLRNLPQKGVAQWDHCLKQQPFLGKMTCPRMESRTQDMMREMMMREN